MPLILGANSLAGGYQVKNSARFNSGSSDNLSKTFSSAGSRQKWTWSCWHKRSILGSSNQQIFSSGTYPPYDDTSSFSIAIRDDQIKITTGANNLLISTPLYRDVSAWYHIVISVDTTQATNTNRIRLYVNNSEVTQYTNSAYISQNASTSITNNVIHAIGKDSSGSSYLDGYLSECYLIDGQQLTPSSFGETDEDSGIWKPKAYTGTFGTNGFYLDFEDSANLGNDMSGNNNDFTVNNLTSIDQTTDTPTNNFATMNPLGNYYPASTFSEGNLKMVTSGSSSTWSYNLTTIGVSAGKWYWETKVTKSSVMSVGICSSFSTGATDEFYAKADGYAYLSNGNVYNNGSTILTSMGTYTTGDIIGVALDLTNNKIYFSKNGTFINSANPANGTNGSTVTAPSSFTSGNYFPAVGDNDTASETFELNFGNPSFTIASGNADANGYGNFEYSVPSGFYSLNSKNLAQYG